MRPPPREEGRIIILVSKSICKCASNCLLTYFTLQFFLVAVMTYMFTRHCYVCICSTVMEGHLKKHSLIHMQNFRPYYVNFKSS